MQTDSAAIEQLLLIMTQLRDSEHGCTWDKVQSFCHNSALYAGRNL